MRPKPKTLSIGSYSWGTMRAEDLIPEFVSVAKSLRLTRDERKTVTQIGNDSSRRGYYESEDSSYDLDSLFDILENHCPYGFYFGSHPGDGADYGCWLSEGFEDDFDGLKVSDTSEVPKGYSGEVLHVSDHGNMTLYAASRGRLREVWAIV